MKNIIWKIFILSLIIPIIIFSIAAKNKHCGDAYDRCCEECYQEYMDTGLSTECYGKCWDEKMNCENDKDGGCFIDAI